MSLKLPVCWKCSRNVACNMANYNTHTVIKHKIYNIFHALALGTAVKFISFVCVELI